MHGRYRQRGAGKRGGYSAGMSLSDADIADDQANYVMTEWETGARPDGLVAEAEYPCGCKAQRVSTAAGWQWVQATDCDEAGHVERGKRH